MCVGEEASGGISAFVFAHDSQGETPVDLHGDSKHISLSVCSNVPGLALSGTHASKRTTSKVFFCCCFFKSLIDCVSAQIQRYYCCELFSLSEDLVVFSGFSEQVSTNVLQRQSRLC